MHAESSPGSQSRSKRNITTYAKRDTRHANTLQRQDSNASIRSLTFDSPEKIGSSKLNNSGSAGSSRRTSGRLRAEQSARNGKEVKNDGPSPSKRAKRTTIPARRQLSSDTSDLSELEDSPVRPPSRVRPTYPSRQTISDDEDDDMFPDIAAAISFPVAGPSKPTRVESTRATTMNRLRRLPSLQPDTIFGTPSPPPLSSPLSSPSKPTRSSPRKRSHPPPVVEIPMRAKRAPAPEEVISVPSSPLTALPASSYLQALDGSPSPSRPRRDRTKKQRSFGPRQVVEARLNTVGSSSPMSSLASSPVKRSPVKRKSGAKGHDTSTSIDPLDCLGSDGLDDSFEGFSTQPLLISAQAAVSDSDESSALSAPPSPTTTGTPGKPKVSNGKATKVQEIRRKAAQAAKRAKKVRAEVHSEDDESDYGATRGKKKSASPVKGKTAANGSRKGKAKATGDDTQYDQSKRRKGARRRGGSIGPAPKPLVMNSQGAADYFSSLQLDYAQQKQREDKERKEVEIDKRYGPQRYVPLVSRLHG